MIDDDKDMKGVERRETERKIMVPLGEAAVSLLCSLKESQQQ